MEDRVGQRLGNYRLIRLLGRGGFAEVYLGQHLRLNSYAAVKVLYTRLASVEEVEKFQKEAQTIAHLEHPNIVRVFDFDVVNDTPFLVMSYAPGGTLRQRHSKGSILPLPTIVTYVKQIAEALQYAHDQRVVHRDVKPENMLAGQRDEVLLSDFGIATVAQSSHYQGTQEMVGTMAYMAPEQIEGKPRPASDQYSLGIVVYEWLCGDRPFHGSLTELVGQHLAGLPPPLHEKLPTISLEVEQVVMTALAKDYKQRFDSVKAFAHALEQASQLSQPHLLMTAQITTNSNPSQASQVPVEVPQLAAPVPSMDTPVQPDVMTTPSDRIGYDPVTVMQPNQAGEQVGTPHVLSRSGSQHRGISRRAALVGLGLVGLAVAGGGIAWFAVPRGRVSSSMNPSTATPSGKVTPEPSPTSIPLGTTLFVYLMHSGDVDTVGWSPDGKRIASGSGDNTVQVWDATSGSNVYIYRGHTDGVNAVAWSPDGSRIASGGFDNTIQVWDAINGGNVYTYRGHSDSVEVVAWSPDGNRIASGGNDKTVQVWNATNGGNVFIYHGHSNTVWTLAWSPDSHNIVSGSADKTAQVWLAG